MGNIRNAQGQYDEGLDFHLRALENFRATVGDKHYFTGDCWYAVGCDYIRKAQNEVAV